MTRLHQPGRAVFWKPFPSFPASARLAVVVGDPSKPGPYVIRVNVPSGVKLMPHKHPEDRVYTSTDIDRDAGARSHSPWYILFNQPEGGRLLGLATLKTGSVPRGSFAQSPGCVYQANREDRGTICAAPYSKAETT